MTTLPPWFTRSDTSLLFMGGPYRPLVREARPYLTVETVMTSPRFFFTVLMSFWGQDPIPSPRLEPLQNTRPTKRVSYC